MESIVIFVHVIAAIAITGLVLIQHGKGADMGASFGSGASQTIFGSSGSGNVLSKSTSFMALVFFITSLFLAIMAREQADLSIDDSGLIENLNEISIPAPVTEPVLDDIPVAIETAEDIPQVADDIPTTD